MNNSSTITRENKVFSRFNTSLLNQGSAQDYALYRHRRARFLQQSALYLGADLSDSKVLSLCYSDNPAGIK